MELEQEYKELAQKTFWTCSEGAAKAIDAAVAAVLARDQEKRQAAVKKALHAAYLQQFDTSAQFDLLWTKFHIALSALLSEAPAQPQPPAQPSNCAPGELTMNERNEIYVLLAAAGIVAECKLTIIVDQINWVLRKRCAPEGMVAWADVKKAIREVWMEWDAKEIWGADTFMEKLRAHLFPPPAPKMFSLRDEIVRLVHDFMGEGTSSAPIFNLTDEILAELEKRGLIAELKEQVNGGSK